MSDPILLAKLAKLEETVAHLNKQVRAAVAALPVQFATTYTGDLGMYCRTIREQYENALKGLLKFHPEGPETGAELPPECWHPLYLAAVNKARIAAGLEYIVFKEPEKSPQLPEGYSFIDRGHTQVGDLVWTGREWCHAENTDDHVGDFLAVARRTVLMEARQKRLRAWRNLVTELRKNSAVRDGFHMAHTPSTAAEAMLLDLLEKIQREELLA